MQIRTINKEIAKLGIEATLIKGDGYFYFIGDDIADGIVESIYVNSLNQLTMKNWMQELQWAVDVSRIFRCK